MLNHILELLRKDDAVCHFSSGVQEMLPSKAVTTTYELNIKAYLLTVADDIF